jgi:hypothetical protein
MVIESLGLYYHIECFRCFVCNIPLSSSFEGTDVRVRNNRLHCQNCFSDDNGENNSRRVTSIFLLSRIFHISRATIDTFEIIRFKANYSVLPRSLEITCKINDIHSCVVVVVATFLSLPSPILLMLIVTCRLASQHLFA